MTDTPHYLSASEAAARLGVSAKALRLYEQQGLLAPGRTAAGYRAYGPDDMARGAEIAALRALGLSLAQVARVLSGAADSLEPALAAHEANLESEVRRLVGTVDKVRRMRADLARGEAPRHGELARLLNPAAELGIGFVLPWPWGGEWFELRDIRPLNYIIGPLGSGKTRLAIRLAETLPDAAFLGLERSMDSGGWIAAPAASLPDRGPQADAALASRVARSLAWLIDEGAFESDALTSLLAGLECEGPAALVVDMVEQGLDHATQQALRAFLRHRAKTSSRPLFLTTRSSAILDLSAVGSDEAIILCPANHSPPTRVAPYCGAPGYEAVATCLASPEVRQRTAGMVARFPQAS